MSGAAHANGDKVYDIATGYWIEAKQEAAASAGRMRWAVYLYDDEGTFVEKYEGNDFDEADKDKWLFAGFDMTISTNNATWRIFLQYLPSHNIALSRSSTSTTLKQYFSGEQGYAINADYAVIDVQPYSITENGTYTAPFSKAYSPVTVDVQEQPWQPLEDGYSNFWFELTDDTLSPWLNFSAKNNDAVIDWGDGSGEVALDTLTPTHTYSKAGKYVVKVKGVTKLGYQNVIKTAYTHVLQYVELNDEVTEIGGASTYPSGFYGCVKLKAIAGLNHITNVNSTFNVLAYTALNEAEINMSDTGSYMLAYVSTLQKITFGNTVVNIKQRTCVACVTLNNVVIPSSVTDIGAYAFQGCASLNVIHVQATTPPTLGANAFATISSDYIIYVPVGTGETYKAAAGWSTYADHILEEGQTPNRAMLSRLAKAVETDTDEDMR